MIDDELRRFLRCPIDKGELLEVEQALACPLAHRFPIVEGVPVLSLADVEPTLHVVRSSIDAGFGRGSTHLPLFLETVGMDESQRALAMEQFQHGENAVDPVVNFLVAHTNGILYKHLVGALRSYPIPDIELPSADGERLLDLGCSWGRWCIAAALKGYRPVGIDPSLGAVLAARRVAENMGLQIQWVVGDARHLPFADHVFDVVYSYSVFQHLGHEDLVASCREADRVLNDRGFVQMQLANKYGLRSLYHQVRRRFRTPRAFEVRYRSPAAMRKLFPEARYLIEIKADCYFGLGLQKADAALMPIWKRCVLFASELIKKVATFCRPLRLAADSLFVIASRK